MAKVKMGVLLLAISLAGLASFGEEGGIGTLDFRVVVKEATNKVFPALVFVKCIRESYEGGKKEGREVVGSGVIVSASGEVLTNWHVVEKATEVRCLLYDGRAMDAEVVGTDKDTDLALLRLRLPAGTNGVPHAEMGDSQRLKEGDFVMAMGAPWGLARSVSIGIVSCTRRFIPERSEYSLWLQTDASVCPGNSGGPLVDTDGRVVGITTMATMVGGDMGLAIPAETVNVIVPQLREYKEARWSWTGLQLQPLRDFEKNIYFEADEGVMVAETDPESPARRAGVQPGDRIIKINGSPVTAMTEEDLPALRRFLGLLPKKENASIDLVRNGQQYQVTIVPREKGKVEGEEYDCARWDLTVKEINQFDNPDLYFHRKKGVFIFSVKHPGNASEAGLTSRDIVLKIDGQEVTTLEDVRKIHKTSLENITKKPRVVMSVLRNGLFQQRVLDITRDYEKE